MMTSAPSAPAAASFRAIARVCAGMMASTTRAGCVANSDMGAHVAGLHGAASAASRGMGSVAQQRQQQQRQQQWAWETAPGARAHRGIAHIDTEGHHHVASMIVHSLLLEAARARAAPTHAPAPAQGALLGAAAEAHGVWLGDAAASPADYCLDSVKRKRKRKMNKHKYQKRMKKQKK